MYKNNYNKIMIYKKDDNYESNIMVLVVSDIIEDYVIDMMELFETEYELAFEAMIEDVEYFDSKYYKNIYNLALDWLDILEKGGTRIKENRSYTETKIMLNKIINIAQGGFLQ